MRRKKLYYLLSGLIFLCLFCIPVYGTEQQGPETIRVGYFDYDGFLEQDKKGEFSGYGYEYLNEISYYLNWNYKFVYGSWEDCLKRLADGDIDLLCTAQYSEERAQIYDYAKYSSGLESATLLVRKDNNSVFYNDYASFDKLRVGFMMDSFQNELFKAYAEQHQFSYTPVYYETAVQLKEALDSGKVDAMLTGSLQKVMDEKAVAKFSPEPFYFITTKGNQKLLDQLNIALEEIQTSDIDFNVKLYDKYYGEASASQLAFTKEEASYIESHPTLRVAYHNDWSPVSFEDADKKQFSGICRDLMDLLSRRSSISFEYIPAASEREVLSLLSSGQADLACPLTDRVFRQSGKLDVVLTKGLLEMPVTLSKLSSVAFEDIKTIAIPENCTSLLKYAEEVYPGCEILVYQDTEGCMQAVKYGMADAVFENVHVLEQYTKDRLFPDLEPVLSAQVSMPLCIAINDDEDFALRSLLNKLISQMSDDEVSQITIKNTMEGPRLHLGQITRRYFVPGFVFLLFIILLAVLRSRLRVERYAFVDPLTKRGNETKFFLNVEKLFKQDRITNYCIVSLDIDKFKFVNSILGFEMGNKVLCAVADIVAEDLQPGELFCRESNDLFILLVRSQKESELTARLERLMGSAAAVPDALGVRYQYSLSCGVYEFIEDDTDLHQSIARANLAREKAKEHLQYKVVFYNDSMRRDVMREQEITSRMEGALTNGEFQVYYQPKIRLRDEKIVGAEALVRWITNDRGIICPDEFIPLFERNGFVISLDLYVFEQVCKQIRVWIENGVEPCPISVNLSRIHLNQLNFYVQYFEIMERYKIVPNLIELEITESTIFENKSQITVLIDKLKLAGVPVSIDDFGSGYSSLNLMKDLPFDFLKLDKEFFNMASDTKRGQDVISSIIDMAGRLHMTVVAEGVETKEQVEFLKENHCEIVQGYYYSKPLPLAEFEERLKRSQSSAASDE